MLYRKLGKTGCDVSVLGFGCVRFPIVGGASAVDLFDPSKPTDGTAASGMIVELGSGQTKYPTLSRNLPRLSP